MVDPFFHRKFIKKNRRLRFFTPLFYILMYVHYQIDTTNITLHINADALFIYSNVSFKLNELIKNRHAFLRVSMAENVRICVSL